MRHLIRLLCLFFAWGLLWLTSGCREEWPPEDLNGVPVISLSGGVIAPASPQKNIRMDSMKIHVLLQDQSYVIDAVFRLFNTADATTEWVGFPKHGHTRPSGYAPNNNRVIDDFMRFEGWVNGRRELFEERRPFLRGNSCSFPWAWPRGIWQETRWMAKKIVFPKNTVTTVRIRYEAAYEDTRHYSKRRDAVTFYLVSGEYWKESIIAAEIVVENPADQGLRRTSVYFPGWRSELCKKTISKTRIAFQLKKSSLELDVLFVNQYHGVLIPLEEKEHE